MSQPHHGEPDATSQLSGMIAMLMLAIFTFGMFISSVMYSSNAAQGTAGRPVPTMVRR
jgi:heme/copper-type cytochrome/quinol oxidase subunit 3